MQAVCQAKRRRPRCLDVAVNDAWGVDDAGRVHHRPPRATFATWDPAVAIGWRSRQRLQLTPVRIVPGRDSLADARNAIAQADVAAITAGVAELGEAKILFRHDE